MHCEYISTNRTVFAQKLHRADRRNVELVFEWTSFPGGGEGEGEYNMFVAVLKTGYRAM